MRILVTGSSGFVGGALVDHLRSQGHDVRGLSRSGAGTDLTGDLLDKVSLEAAVSDFAPEVIYNLAAATDLKGPPTAGYDVNTTGVSNLIDVVEVVPAVSRVIWMSSQLVGKPGVPLPSDTVYDPVGGYGESKAEGERRVRSADGGGKIWTIVRSTTIWGPGMSEHYVSVLRLIRCGLYFHAGWKPLKKSYSYIHNLSAQLATLATVDAERIHRQTFYLADTEPVELRSWTNRFAVRFGRRIPTFPAGIVRLLAIVGDAAAALHLPSPLTTARLNNLLTRYIHDTGPIESLHGATAISNEEGVDRMADWFLALDRQRKP